MHVKAERLRFGSYEIGCIILNRPEALNALSLEMLDTIRQQLVEWESDERIGLVWFESSIDRAFCSGGDVKALVLEILSGNSHKAESFFTSEYSLDYYLHTYTKPVVAWASGLTMGGGLGLINGCSHRIVTPKTTVAMPEIGIGFFPDVGAGYFLNQLPPGVGLVLGLTGCRIGGEEAVCLGLADGMLDSKIKVGFLNRLGDLLENVKTPIGKISSKDSPLKEIYQQVSELMKELQLPVRKTQLWNELLSLGRELSALPEMAKADEFRQTLEAHTFQTPQLQSAQEQFLSGSALVAEVI